MNAKELLEPFIREFEDRIVYAQRLTPEQCVYVLEKLEEAIDFVEMRSPEYIENYLKNSKIVNDAYDDGYAEGARDGELGLDIEYAKGYAAGYDEACEEYEVGKYE